MKKFVRVRENSMLAGVCSGAAKYFDTDVNLVRVITIIACLIVPALILGYIIIALIIPMED